MTSGRRPFREFDDSYDAESLRLARRVIRGLSLTMRHVVLAPGSRSAPLAYALAEAEQLGVLDVHMRIDERSAAFTALGLAMSTGQPAGVVTTSGTAAGNLLPAVMEADLAGIPLVVITADRPESLHGTGANQTVWQQGMFARRVRDELHIDQSFIAEGQVRLEPESRDDMLAAETQAALLVRAAVTATARSAPGPVHLNIGFADPLVPEEVPTPQAGIQRWARKGVIPAQERERLYQQARSGSVSPAEQLEAAALGERLGFDSEPLQPTAGSSDQRSADAQQTIDDAAHEPVTRTLFVMGHGAQREAVDFAVRTGHPMLAEPTSGARWSDLGAIQAYRLLLQAPRGSAGEQLVAQTERVVVVGRPTLTRPVQRLIARQDIEVLHYAPGAEPWHDHRLPRRIITDLRELAGLTGTAAAGWRQAWQDAGLAAQRVIDAVLREDEQEHSAPSSVRAAQFVAETVRTPLLLGSSSVIRDVDLTAVLTRSLPGSAGTQSLDGAGPGGRPRAVYALRGLAGIDGNLSAASGVALAAGERITALVGDLTFLHDVNALLLPSTEQVPQLDIVVINDGGGAIFDQLEHGAVGRRSGQAESVERLFGTPQDVDIEALADAYHHEYYFAETLQELGEALAHPDDRLGMRIIEVRTDRVGLRDLHQRISERVAEL
ncbi:2-succinyl-5-enolpyruvyl-6-hydroxy-3-cyclohexene-1-carboxylic-acid synthase [Nesterenkonia massiliensis]|uniref:2-succinyl-5-enolpyruvyl-6-hydroxy-3-cyclohexene-1-carboxylate synthase n=1 Tax=Nesterenkonia massiliensis TaxID=1232429 RepID=A0ABT2HP91_9MICC|nr:2-succinyl-5-enolpyruvyl-6-hydroxy-3-cyclohexene-1-carboxylic-acid synthase [Nesterenkonia massiliensis]MCT1606491.1 2-succinyl-5-enolpyruvyl-6-hydroxy-3-cyclohexene-1-carboxylic-acid synthase [Nesterenkonia massiliensis]